MRCRVRTAVALALAVALGLGTPSGASAAPPVTVTRGQVQQAIKGKITTLRSQVAEASADEERLLGQLDDADARLEELNAKVGALDMETVAAQSDLEVAQGRLTQAEARLVDANGRLKRAERDLAAAKDEMRARAVAAYTEGPALEGAADLLLHSSDARELVARTEYMGTVIREQQRTVERYRRLRDQMGGLKDSLVAAREEAFGQRNDVARRQVDLRAARVEQDRIRQGAASQQAQREQLLAEVRSRKAEFQGQIAALQRESDSITVLLQTRQASTGSVQVAGRGILASPVPGASMTSRFGSRVHPIFGDVRMHAGLDFGAAAGTPIQAAADGVVVFAGVRGGYGNATILDHGGSLATLYAHQSAFLVSEGQTVAKGQVIGRVGSTGYATGPHLHFEVRVSGTPVDPLNYL